MEEIFDFAMQMEQDGKAYYEKEAAKTNIPALKKILMGLAEDEIRHYNIFKRLKEKHSADLGQLSEKTTAIMKTTRNIFEEMAKKDSNVDTRAEAIEVWTHAQEIEKKSEDFYRAKAKEVADPQAKEILIKIAAEEAMHWAVIESVRQFLERPKTWLEDAEWSNLEDY
jgi:rubrerythrin